MKIRTVRYLLKDGIMNLWTNKIMSIASIGTMTSCLVIFGVFVLFFINIAHMLTVIQDQCRMQAFLEDSLSDKAISEIGIMLSGIPEVKDIEFESREQAFNNYKKELDDNAWLMEGIEDDYFLPPSYIITVTDIKYMHDVELRLSSIPGIEKVRNRQNVVDALLNISAFIKWGGFWMILLLGIVSVFIISNTIKLTVFARRKEISIMKFVGATNAYIRLPFIIEGILIGVIGALISLFLVIYGYKYTHNTLVSFLGFYEIKTAADVFQTILVAFMSIGVTIGCIGSVVSIRKYLCV